MKKNILLILLTLSAVFQIPSGTVSPLYAAEQTTSMSMPAPSQPLSRSSNQIDKDGEIDYAQIYEPLIAEWESCLIKHNSQEELQDTKFNFRFYAGSGSTRAYYSIHDIDGNGVPELILKKVKGGEEIIAYIFTVKDGIPISLFNDEYGDIEVPWSRRGSAEILSSGLIDCRQGSFSIYKIAGDGYTLLEIASSEPYNYPSNAGLALADWRYYINGVEVDYDYYIQYLNEEEGYSLYYGSSNVQAEIEWTEVSDWHKIDASELSSNQNNGGKTVDFTQAYRSVINYNTQLHGTTVDYTQAYGSIITEWQSCMTKHNNRESLKDARFNFEFFGWTHLVPAKAYYSLYDIDDNGVMELILRKKYGSYEDIIAYIFTVKDGVPVSLFNFGNGDIEVPWRLGHSSAVILKNGTIDCWFGNGALYRIADDGCTLLEIVSRKPNPDLADDLRYYISGKLTDYGTFKQYLDELGYSTIKNNNDAAGIVWVELINGIQ